MTTELAVLWCASCREERAFERPPCPDGHGPECEELACTSCGEAIFGPVTLGWSAAAGRTQRRRGRRRVA